jgi:NAD(P)-dependent dehydrogenase (short-subunit alcohol dehydrogenase family)
MGKLDGRIALITGGDHGIGFLTAKEFVKEGAYVFITGSSHSRLAAAVKQIEAEELRGTRVGRNVLGVQGVVSNAGELDHVFAQIEREKGELDVVFAATNEKISDNLTERENHSSFDKYMNGTFATVNMAIPLLGESACVILLSVSGKENTSRNDSVEGSAIRSFWRAWINKLKNRGCRSSKLNLRRIRWSVPSAHAPIEWLFGRIGPRWIAIDSSM